MNSAEANLVLMISEVVLLACMHRTTERFEEKGGSLPSTCAMVMHVYIIHAIVLYSGR